MAKKKSASTKKPAVFNEPLAVYQSLVDGVPDLKIKGAKANYTSLNGNMFSFQTTENQLALRLSDSDRDAFLAKYPGSECYQYGATMRGYVVIPDAVLQNTKQLKALFAKCVANAHQLKSKPTTRKKPAQSAKKTSKKSSKKAIKKVVKKATKKRAKKAAKKAKKKK